MIFRREMNDSVFFREKRANKDHICSICGGSIPKKSSYVNVTGVLKQYTVDLKMHKICYACIADCLETCEHKDRHLRKTGLTFCKKEYRTVCMNWCAILSLTKRDYDKERGAKWMARKKAYEEANEKSN